MVTLMDHRILLQRQKVETAATSASPSASSSRHSFIRGDGIRMERIFAFSYYFPFFQKERIQRREEKLRQLSHSLSQDGSFKDDSETAV